MHEMSLLSRWSFTALLVVGLGLSPAGCSGDDSAPSDDGHDSAPPSPAVTLAFTETDTLQLGLGDEREIVVQVSPPSIAAVRFTLLGEHGDGALEQSRVFSDEAGIARTTLHASREPTTFRLRASLDKGAAIERAVSVSGSGFATLIISPSYTGSRSAQGWTASVDASGLSCATLSAEPPPDGPLVTQGTAPLRLDGVPAGQPLVVTLRSAGLLGGCADVGPLTANESRKLTVSAKNVPPKLAPVTLSTTLVLSPVPKSIQPNTVTWPEQLSRWRGRFLQAFLGGSTNANSALLDTIAVSLSAPERVAFQLARQQMGWDALLENSQNTHKSPAVLGGWLSKATAALEADPGALDAILSASPQTPDNASFTPQRLSILKVSDGDELSEKNVTWIAAPDDRVQMGGELSFWPSHLMARALTNLLGVSDPQGVASTLQQAVHCEGVASELSIEEVVFPACNTACVQQLCNDALITMWERALHDDEFKGASSLLTFSASGALSLDDDAHVTGFSGMWLGTLTDPSSGQPGGVAFKGPASASLLTTSN